MTMASYGGYTQQQRGRPLPRFGEWDVNNPSSADGFTVIFAKARDDKKATGTAASAGVRTANYYKEKARPTQPPPPPPPPPPPQNSWFCCCC